MGSLAELGERRQHDDSHDGEPNPRVGIQTLSGVVGDQQWQEVEDTLPSQVDELPARGQGDARVGPVSDDAQRTHEGHECDEQGGAEQGAHDRPERVGQVLEEVVEPRELASGTLGAMLRLDVRVRLIAAAGRKPFHGG